MVRGVGFFGNLGDPGEAGSVEAGCSGERGGRSCGGWVCTRVNGGGYVGKRRVPMVG